MLQFYMLFNSYEFIFLFLTPTVLGFYLLQNRRERIWLLVLASVLFYGEWSLSHLAILLISVYVNYMLALFLKKWRGLYLLQLSIILNLLPLAYFKYSYFLHFSSHTHLLPLAISFYTFQQIAFLVDVYRGETEVEGFREYVVFVLFFPQLVAGPIVHYRDLIPQMKSPDWLKFESGYIGCGLVLFAMGLFKKVVLADNFGVIADGAFGSGDLSSYMAWIGVLSYSMQIYFDFSGYGDMAVGLGLLFKVRLPINFNSPYKSKNMVEFWRRWHITLSRFLRDYLYIPLGGNRVGRDREIFNLLVTMLIGGIWHGAGWGFLVWGFLHGVFLALSHFSKIELPRYVGVGFTFVIVTLLWVFFRANDIDSALLYYRVLFDFSHFGFDKFELYKEGLIAIGFLVIWFLPNSFEITGYMNGRFVKRRWVYIASGILFFIALKVMAGAPSRAFVYFNF